MAMLVRLRSRRMVTMITTMLVMAVVTSIVDVDAVVGELVMLIVMSTV